MLYDNEGKPVTLIGPKQIGQELERATGMTWHRQRVHYFISSRTRDDGFPLPAWPHEPNSKGHRLWVKEEVTAWIYDKFIKALTERNQRLLEQLRKYQEGDADGTGNKGAPQAHHQERSRTQTIAPAGNAGTGDDSSTVD